MNDSTLSANSRPLAPPPTDHVPQAYDGPTLDEALAMRAEYLTPGLVTMYRDPLMIVEGHMQYLSLIHI